jgi:hypothetical protein
MINCVDLYLENYGLSNFAYLEIELKDNLDQDAVQKVNTSNHARIMPMHVFPKNEQLYIRYELVSDYTLDKYFSNSLTKEKLIFTISNILQSLSEAEAYGLDTEKLLIDKRSIYIDAFTNQLVLLYIPVQTNYFEKVTLYDFFKSLLTISPYDEEDDSLFFLRLHNYLLTPKDIGLSEWIDGFRKLGAFVEGLSSMTKAAVTAEKEAEQSNFYRPGQVEVKTKSSFENGVHTSQYSSKKTDKRIENNKLEIEEELQYKRITRTDVEHGEKLTRKGTSLQDSAIKLIPKIDITQQEDEMEEEGTTVLGGHVSVEEEGGTTMLGVENYSTNPPYLQTGVMREKIFISKSMFKIGRDPNATDYHCQNKVVGRIHAYILHENGQYFLEDNPTRNGSFVNDKRLHTKEKVKIKHDDQIKLANEQFVFKLF